MSCFAIRQSVYFLLALIEFRFTKEGLYNTICRLCTLRIRHIGRQQLIYLASLCAFASRSMHLCLGKTHSAQHRSIDICQGIQIVCHNNQSIIISTQKHRFGISIRRLHTRCRILCQFVHTAECRSRLIVDAIIKGHARQLLNHRYCILVLRLFCQQFHTLNCSIKTITLEVAITQAKQRIVGIVALRKVLQILLQVRYRIGSSIGKIDILRRTERQRVTSHNAQIALHSRALGISEVVVDIALCHIYLAYTLHCISRRRRLRSR